jgi:hypothetical protein
MDNAKVLPAENHSLLNAVSAAVSHSENSPDILLDLPSSARLTSACKFVVGRLFD